MARRNPHAQEQNRSREKSRLGYPEKKSKNVKTSCRRDPGKKQRNNSPCDHDPGKPNTCAKFVQRQITWHLKDYVANKENAGGKSKLGGRQAKILVHAVGTGKGNRCPIEIVDEEHQGQEGDQPDSELPYRGLFDGIHGHVIGA